MLKRSSYLFNCTLCVFSWLIATAALAQGPTAQAELKDAAGKAVGTAMLRETPNGVVITAKFTALPAGSHALHVHAVGKCEPPFDSAGPHFNPQGKKHGFTQPDGPHAGDLPNVSVT